MDYAFEHGLHDRHGARALFERAFESYRQRFTEFRPTLTWTGPDQAEIRFVVMAKPVCVTVALDDRKVFMHGKLPLFFKPFERRVLEAIEHEVRHWVKADPPETS